MAITILESEPIAAKGNERPALSKVAAVLKTSHGKAKLVGSDGVEVLLPASLFDIIERAAQELTQGEAVAIVPIHKELTTQQAADILDVSRQYLVRLLDQEAIPCTKVGSHRRVKFGDLMDYKRQRDATRRAGLRHLAELSQEMRLYGESER